MDHKVWLEKLFKSIDDRDIQGFLGFLSDTATFRFGNAEAVQEKTNIGEVVEGFFSSIKSLQHTVNESWFQTDHLICHGSVSYTRHDNTELTVPFANILKLDGELVEEYLIFADVSRLYVET